MKPQYLKDYYPNLLSWHEFENIINIRPLMTQEKVHILSPEANMLWENDIWTTNPGCYPPTVLREAVQRYVCWFTEMSRTTETINNLAYKIEKEFKSAVNKVKEYIKKGDVMQVVCSQRMSIPFNSDPVALYRAVRYLNPSPYMYYLNLKDFHIVGSSPEILARLEDGDVTVRPIAGTRRRGKNKDDDKAMELDMVNDPKEIAEHLMLIDLGRNDVGRIAEPGSVEVTEKFGIERYSHVMHLSLIHISEPTRPY